MTAQIKPDNTQAVSPGDHTGNICGVLVRARPEEGADVAEKLKAIGGVEVHHRHDDGHIIITIEDTEEGMASDAITQVHNVDGVLVASLVYHHSGEALSNEEKKP